ncbi:amidohydrolase family protein, partial [Candidatus Bathyarchaeota archaeon]|nr:amidohydrolase family protein [Candidatus Bathyarchaeota archaeon]
ETGSGIVPFQYRRSNYVNAIQWGIGLELALMVEDPWRVFLTTDHPNGGPFTAYPRVIAWLMSKKARERTMSKMNRTARRRLDLPGLDREYTLEEISIITRAAPAKSLGLSSKGHLGIGADADVAVYDLDASKNYLEKNPSMIKRTFTEAYLTVKDGKIVSKRGEVTSAPAGRTFYVDCELSPELESDLVRELRMKFRDYYTIEIDNYPILDSFLRSPSRIPCRGEV